ncbi:hypothetical protein N7528_009525 [Penicillium herquei]|nr:hypothetical protein N7528_009525 [Penicillium herquei]
MATTSTLSAQEHLIATIGEVAYYIPNSPSHSVIAIPETAGVLRSAVLLRLDDTQLTLQHLESTFRDFSARDDVFQTDFIQGGLIIIPTRSEISEDYPLPDDLEVFLDFYSASLVFSQSLRDVPEGPYFVKGNHLRQAWRLYEDVALSFVTTVIPHDMDSFRFRPVPVSAYTGLYLIAAVPSRLYFKADATKPLNGKRITVKDNFNLSGVVTTMGSRSYTSYYGVQNETAPYVKELIAQGAVIVGKTKMSAYTGFEVPPEKTINYLAPFNPRGDGYQGPSGSSSGAGSCIAAYDWVDISLGTDS